ncbi:MAG TPA: hypothetical protein VLE72_04385 [Candidatus Saccharimonadales bacterium]|nr:hypothetical protein [Candidatus Saccharimonadales bacterium]
MSDLRALEEGERYRCTACGNLTRFDVVHTKRSRSFYHFTVGGELSVEEDEVLNEEIETISCRWCGSEKIEINVDLAQPDPTG